MARRNTGNFINNLFIKKKTVCYSREVPDKNQNKTVKNELKSNYYGTEDDDRYKT